MVGANSILNPVLNGRMDLDGLNDVMACLGKVLSLLVLTESPQLSTMNNLPISYFVVGMMQNDNPVEVVKKYGKDIVTSCDHGPFGKELISVLAMDRTSAMSPE